MSDPTVTFTVRLPAEDTAKLARLAKKYERSMSFLVRAAVALYLEAEAQR